MRAAESTSRPTATGFGPPTIGSGASGVFQSLSVDRSTGAAGIPTDGITENHTASSGVSARTASPASVAAVAVLHGAGG